MQPNERVDLRLPAELHRPTPRPLPRDFGSNVSHQKRKQQTILWIGAGIFLMVLHFVPVIKALGFFSWPFLILFWVGLVCCAIGVFMWLKPIWFKSPKMKRVEDYIEHAEVASAEVKELVKIPVSYYRGQVSYQAFAVELAMEHPEIGSEVQLQVKSDSFPAHEIVSPKFRTGDHVPVVWHKEKFDSTLQIYEFLEATPDSSLQRPPISIWPTVRDLAIIFVCLSVLVWSAYIFGKYATVGFGWDDLLYPASIGLGIGIASAIILSVIQILRLRTLHAKNESAILAGDAFDVVLEKKTIWTFVIFGLCVGLGVSIIATCVTTAGCLAVNALLDDSPAKEEIVKITDTYEDIPSAIHREFIVEFEMDGVKGIDGKQKFRTTPKHMASFKGPTGLAEVHDGYLGWRWIKAIKPINPDDEDLAKEKKAID